MLKNKRFLTHFIFWTIHTTFGFFAWDLRNYEPGFLLLFSGIIITSIVSTILFFYLHYLYLVPHFLLRKKYWSYFLLVILSIIVFVLCKAYSWNAFKFVDGFFVPHQRGGIVFHVIFYYCLSTAFRMYDYWKESEEKRIALQEEVYETELLYLKSQMSPHFLFNTLNNIYGLSLNNSPQTSLSIRQLKELMIYVEKFESGHKITIEEEIEYLKSFIALNQLRHAVQVEFQYTTTVNKKTTYIEPMIFLPFIENAFKHGKTDKENSISVSLSVDPERIYFTVKNNIGLDKRKDDVGGIGIKNVIRRLEILYPESHFLKTVKEDKYFIVELTLKHHE